MEEQTREHERAIIELKRTRNSLLNISKLPPEVLGNIFRWNTAPTSDFLAWVDRTHNFLFVCHHWFEVGSRTPELWSFWGTSLKEWKLCCRYPGAAPLDLVLDGNPHDDHLDRDLHKILQGRATRDTIRRIYLKANAEILLSSIISSLTVNCEEFQSNSLESFTLLHDGIVPVDLTNFFAHCRFPKLQHLEFSGYVAPRWDLLWSRTGALTTLILDSVFPSPMPTTSELLSTLAFNPALQKVSVAISPPRDGITSSIRVSLRNLKDLGLSGDVRDVVGVLRLLDHPSKLDLSLGLHNCTVGDISRIVSPYLRDYVGRRGRPQNGLGVYVSEGGNTIGHNVGDVGTLDPSIPSDRVAWFLSIGIYLDETPPKDLLERAILDLITYTPQEEITYFHAFKEPLAIEVISAHFPNIKALHFGDTSIRPGNLGGDREIFPSLQSIYLHDVIVGDDDWSPLTTFLARHASSGNQLDTLEVFGSPHMCIEVVEDIRNMVRHFRTEPPHLRRPCPFDTCPDP